MALRLGIANIDFQALPSQNEMCLVLALLSRMPQPQTLKLS